MYHLPLLFNRKKTKKPDASAGLAGRWHTALGSGVWEEVAGPGTTGSKHAPAGRGSLCPDLVDCCPVRMQGW